MSLLHKEEFKTRGQWIKRNGIRIGTIRKIGGGREGVYDCKNKQTKNVHTHHLRSTSVKSVKSPRSNVIRGCLSPVSNDRENSQGACDRGTATDDTSFLPHLTNPLFKTTPP